MTTFELLEYAAWGVSLLLGLWMLIDMIRTDKAYSEELLTSSVEGEIEHAPGVDPPRARESE